MALSALKVKGPLPPSRPHQGLQNSQGAQVREGVRSWKDLFLGRGGKASSGLDLEIGQAGRGKGLRVGLRGWWHLLVWPWQRCSDVLKAPFWAGLIFVFLVSCLRSLI